jgi:hypothetical protein
MYATTFLGQTIDCETLHHSAAVKKASDILSGATDVRSDDNLYDLVALVLHYGQADAAERLRNMAKAIPDASSEIALH